MEGIKQKLSEGLGPIWEKIKGASESAIETVKSIPNMVNDSALGHKLQEAGVSKELISYTLGGLFVSTLVIIAVVISRRMKAKSNVEKIVEALQVDSPSRLCGVSCLAAIVALAFLDVFVVQPRTFSGWPKNTKKGIRAAILSAVLICAIVAESKLFPSVTGHKETSTMFLMHMAVAVAAIASAQLSVRVLQYFVHKKERKAGDDSEAED